MKIQISLAAAKKPTPAAIKKAEKVLTQSKKAAFSELKKRRKAIESNILDMEADQERLEVGLSKLREELDEVVSKLLGPKQESKSLPKVKSTKNKIEQLEALADQFYDKANAAARTLSLRLMKGSPGNNDPVKIEERNLKLLHSKPQYAEALEPYNTYVKYAKQLRALEDAPGKTVKKDPDAAYNKAELDVSRFFSEVTKAFRGKETKEPGTAYSSKFPPKNFDANKLKALMTKHHLQNQLVDGNRKMPKTIDINPGWYFEHANEDYTSQGVIDLTDGTISIN